jgi:hypothetical protein
MGELADFRFHLKHAGYWVDDEEEVTPPENQSEKPTKGSVQTLAFQLIKSIAAATRGSEAPIIVSQLKNLQMTDGEAKSAFNYLKDQGLIVANYSIYYSARLSAAGHHALVVAERENIPRENQLSDEPPSAAALTTIRGAVQDIEMQLPTLGISNSTASEIHADITQIVAEAERPAPRRKFMKLYLESLRDNLAKAAGAGTAAALVAAVAGILAKFFGAL